MTGAPKPRDDLPHEGDSRIPLASINGVSILFPSIFGLISNIFTTRPTELLTYKNGSSSIQPPSNRILTLEKLQELFLSDISLFQYGPEGPFREVLVVYWNGDFQPGLLRVKEARMASALMVNVETAF